MAGRGATLAIRIVSDASQASKGFEQAESRVAGFQRGLDKASVAAGGVLAAVGGVAKAALDSASALQQSTGAVESVFAGQAAAVKAYADSAAQDLGISANAYQESAALIGSQLKTLGFPLDETADKTHGLMNTAADLAATFGGSTEQAVAALSSALKGERDPIEAYGISLSQAAIDAKVAALGLDTSTAAAKANADAQAALALVADQSAAAQGANAREADTAAGAQARASAAFEDAKAALGDVLLPIVADAATKFSELATWLVQNKDVVVPLVAVVSGLAAGILVLNAAMRAYSVVQTIVNAVINASPLMRLVFIIGGIIAIVITMYQKFDWFRSIVDTIGSALRSAFNGARSAIQWVLDKLSFVSDAAGWVGDLFSAAGPMTLAVRPEVAGGTSLAGVYGAAAGVTGPGIFGASMSSGPVGSPTRSTPATAATVINVTVNGALDPVAVGRQLESVLAKYATATGRRPVAMVGAR